MDRTHTHTYTHVYLHPQTSILFISQLSETMPSPIIIQCLLLYLSLLSFCVCTSFFESEKSGFSIYIFICASPLCNPSPHLLCRTSGKRSLLPGCGLIHISLHFPLPSAPEARWPRPPPTWCTSREVPLASWCACWEFSQPWLPAPWLLRVSPLPPLTLTVHQWKLLSYYLLAPN